MSLRAVETNHLRPTRWCVLISGRGSNLAAMLEVPDVDVRLVISSDPEAGGCAKARRAGVPVEAMTVTEAGKIDWDACDQMLRARSIDAIFLLGFMRIVPAQFVEKWAGFILNLHPSLLPKYPGLKSIERAILAQDDCGATVHHVVKEVDAGLKLARRTSVVSADLPIWNSSIETLVHIDEQRLVKEIVAKWRPPTPA